MKTYRYKCEICGNTCDMNKDALPEKWYNLVLNDGFDDLLDITVCRHCLPIPLNRSTLAGIFPMVRKLFGRKND
jgi:hypothetical protein